MTADPKPPFTATFGHHNVIGTHTGWAHCQKRMRASELKEYGVGIVLYFQFIKYLGCMLLLCTLISTPNYLLFYHGLHNADNARDSPAAMGGEQAASEEQVNNNAPAAEGSELEITDYLSWFTVGNLGERHTSCLRLGYSE